MEAILQGIYPPHFRSLPSHTSLPLTLSHLSFSHYLTSFFFSNPSLHLGFRSLSPSIPSLPLFSHLSTISSHLSSPQIKISSPLLLDSSISISISSSKGIKPLLSIDFILDHSQAGSSFYSSSSNLFLLILNFLLFFL